MSKPDLGRIIAQTMAKPVESRTIETITDEILDAKRTGGEAILTIGRCLIEAKDMLPHGEWLPWLNEQVELSERTAQKFMKLAREWSNPNTLADLGASKALMLLALPEGEREQFVEDHNVIDMSARQLEQAIRERDEARKAAEAAKADASAAEQARAKMEADMAATKNLLESARADADSAGSRARVLEEKLRMIQEQPVEVAVETVVDPEAIEKAKAEAVAEIKAKLDKAREAKKRAEDRQKIAEAALEQARLQLEEQAKAGKKAAQNPAPVPEWLPLQWIAGLERPVRLLRAVCKFDLGEEDRDHVVIARWDGTGWSFLSGARIDAPCVFWWPIPDD